jgi:MFS family permease
MLIGSLMTIFASPSARLGYGWLIVCRFITGVAHGAVWPAISSLFINWVPVHEKSRLMGFAYSGPFIGNIISLPLGGYLCAYGFDGGWSSIFYIFGIIYIEYLFFFFSLFLLFLTIFLSKYIRLLTFF